jgi:competence protein ComEA
MNNFLLKNKFLIISILLALIAGCYAYLYYDKKSLNTYNDLSARLDGLENKINNLNSNSESSQESVVIAEEKTEFINPNIEKININIADQIELEKIPGIGPTKAQNIITYRNQNGLFQNIEDIQNVSGIGEATFDKIADYIYIEE